MPIPTSRTKEAALIHIDETLCNGCNLCVLECPDECLVLVNRKAAPAPTPQFGCFACGHCMAICPEDAITITGRCLGAEDLFDLPPREEAASYEPVLKLFQRRRSTRDFKDIPVDPALINKIMDAVKMAPVGIPPSDVHTMILDNKDKVRGFTEDFVAMLGTMKWIVSPLFITIMRPFWSRTTYELFRDFLRPLVHSYCDGMKKGENYVTYDAPCAIYFYGTPYADPADTSVAATYAMIAAESMGLGTCMLGAIHPFIQSGTAAGKLRSKYGIRFKSRSGLFLIIGYPKFKFRKGIRRNLP